MSEPSTKKRKFTHHSKTKNFYAQKSKRQFIEAGQRGFLATCNYREKDCVRECYNILNQYADELYGPQQQEINKADDDQGDECDITDELEKAISEAKTEAKENKFRFQVVDTGTSNCVFIKTTLPDPVELGARIVRDIAANKLQKSRFLLRLVPISIVCRANLKDIVDAAGTLFDKHFLKESHTFAIIYNRRYNNSISRDEIIKELADLVAKKNMNNKVNLGDPELCIIVEVIKGLCCLSVVPEYIQLKKYNLVELAGQSERKTEKEGKKNDKDEGKQETTVGINKESTTEVKEKDEEKQSIDEKQEEEGSEIECNTDVDKK